ncbi:MAG: hypothetical protein BWY11_00168 [Firmicutes bacterium ADurb.Bin182]|nr:MAG: hypothetical protein BWY11_00168 [Firmicutes bacterium ADurb.Bin182]
MPNFTYCIACNAGSEAVLKRELSGRLPEATILYPVFDREEHKDGKWTVKTHPLIPGYLFLYSDTVLAPDLICRSKRVNKVLGYSDTGDAQQHDKSYSLLGEDLDFANWVYKHDGHIKLSRAMLVGDKTTIIDGPLLDYEGEIIKINRQRRSALVRIAIGETRKDVWLSFKWMELKDGELTEWA